VKDYDPPPSGRQLAVRLGPERIAFVLSVIVLIAAAILFGSRIGPPSARPGSSGPAPTPETTAVAQAPGAATLTMRTATGLVASVPGGPARAQA
jgi:hypothetical protein